jgi:hypothetical protein
VGGCHIAESHGEFSRMIRDNIDILGNQVLDI